MGFAAAVLVAVALLVYFGQTKVIFVGGRDVYCTPADAPYHWEYEDLYLDVNGRKTNAWYIPLPDARGTVLFSHGNAGTISDRLASVEVFRGLGFDVLIYDYGGYGRSTGGPSEKRCYADARAMWRYLTEQRGIPAERIVLFGGSLGGGVTAQLATEVTPGAVILKSTFLSIPEVGRELVPLFPSRLLLRHRFDNAAKIGNVKAPVLVVHSRDDELIPIRHGRRLFDLANEPKQFLELRGGHNDASIVSDVAYLDGLRRFLGPPFP